MNLNHILFLDIETVAQRKDFFELDFRLQKQWEKKSKILFKDGSQTIEESYYDRAAIYAEFGKVVTIAVGIVDTSQENAQLRVKSFAGKDEHTVLLGFQQMLKTKMDESKIRFCAHNGKEFDYPYLARRMMVNGIELPKPLQLSGKKPWQVDHYDTMEMWKFGDIKNFTSLELLATIFDIPSSKEAMDGSEVKDYYYQKDDLESIAKYCCEDVVVTAQLFLRLNNLSLIQSQNIKFIN
ncbi:MAG: 3'-5' exonuclease [Bacteroidota bacterium]